jgi:hypothetical protein
MTTLKLNRQETTVYLFGCNEHVPGHQDSNTMNQENKEYHSIPEKSYITK